jgi:hypothetical protein
MHSRDSWKVIIIFYIKNLKLIIILNMKNKIKNILFKLTNLIISNIKIRTVKLKKKANTNIYKNKILN